MTVQLIEEKKLEETRYYTELNGFYVPGSIRLTMEEALDFYNQYIDANGVLEVKKVLLTTELD